ncbi:LPS export ABC transporter permease LptG [Pseudoxanthomonas composti]|uniref:LPS export ABC transporter permease LptG n=1 Tax=Pseudoxanthomonas composti TaxID=2137479 RepID=A0A4Q1JSX6_9GAMM|nr:LPS export ABC transporter permease LptG [Pseudoxanthomonas composti]RXR02778.1 LPS export ABC transporter permease LptG [Pseudoxanthomonas composti]
MKLRPNLHDLYVGRVVLVTVLLTWAVLLGLDLMQALSGELKDVKAGYTLGHAVARVLYTVPRRAYTFFPTAAVIGALMGLGQLAASSELTALRALGLSRRRLSLSVAITMALLTGVMVVGMETVGAWGQSQSDAIMAKVRYGDVAKARYSGLWAREGDTFLNAASGEERVVNGKTDLQLQDVRLYQLDEAGRLMAISHAATAEQQGEDWVLKDVLRTDFGERSVTQAKVPEQRWTSKLDPDALAASMGKPRYMAASDLSRSIEYRTRNGLDAREYEEVYWGRWFYPLNVLSLCLAAIPFAFGSLRSGGLGKRMFLGLLFALGFWLLQLLFGRMATAFRVDYRLALALPPVLLLIVSGFLFKRRSS